MTSKTNKLIYSRSYMLIFITTNLLIYCRKKKVFNLSTSKCEAQEYLISNTTLAPFCRRSSAIDLPIPIAAPVTTAVLPLRAISAVSQEKT